MEISGVYGFKSNLCRKQLSSTLHDLTGSWGSLQQTHTHTHTHMNACICAVTFIYKTCVYPTHVTTYTHEYTGKRW